jgi:hypothetical protein
MVVVDEVGVGGGVLDRLAQLGVSCRGFNASHRALDPGRYLNMRASVWWQTRELFRTGAIDLDPADRELADQLAARVAKSHRALGVPNDDLIGRERMAKATRLAQEEYLASVSPAGFVAYQSGQAA